MINLGYSYKNINLKTTPNKKTTLAKLKRSSDEEKVDILKKKFEANIRNLEKILKWNAQNGIYMYRIPSEFMPFAGLEWIREIWDPYTIYKDELLRIGQLANDLDQRLSVRPNRYVVLSSPKDKVVHNSINQINSQAEVLSSMNLKYQPLIDIQMGGHYNDKAGAFSRFKSNYEKLSDEAQMYLVIENDPKMYAPDELYELYYDIKIPILYDWSHHQWHRGEWDPHYALNMCIDTFIDLGWSRPPKIHISSDVENAKRHHHTNYIRPYDFIQMCLDLTYEGPLDVMVEAKQSDEAVLQLRRQVLSISDNMELYEEDESAHETSSQ